MTKLKTFQETTEKPKLVIQYDRDTESPREWFTLGVLLLVGNYKGSGDQDDTLREVVNETAELATSSENHLNLLKEKLGDKLAIFPVSKYEHGGVSFSRGITGGFDSSHCGFYFVNKKDNELGTKEKDFELVIDAELDNFNSYANGDVYGFVLYDDNGEIEHSCWGFYDPKHEDIREHLPKEWEDEDLTKYFND